MNIQPGSGDASPAILARAARRPRRALPPLAASSPAPRPLAAPPAA